MYASGDKALGICQRCDEKMLLNKLRLDGQYPDLLVCPECYDPKHPQEFLPKTRDPVALYDPTGDTNRAVANKLTVHFPILNLSGAGATPNLSVSVALNSSKYTAQSGGVFTVDAI